jgi:hypothetical protein
VDNDGDEDATFDELREDWNGYKGENSENGAKVEVFLLIY